MIKNKKEFTEKGFTIIKNFFLKKDINVISRKIANIKHLSHEDFFFEMVNNKKKLRRLEKISDKIPLVKKLLNSKKLVQTINFITKNKLVLFKDKINIKYSGGLGYKPHIDGHYSWIDKQGKKNKGWKKYSNFFLNVVIPLDKVRKKNGCLYVSEKKNIKKIGKDFLSIINTVNKNNFEIPKNINQKIKYFPIELNMGDILIFDWRCPHFSKKNYSSLIRKQIYITYCAKKIIDPRKKYYLDRANTKSDKSKLSLLD